MKNCLTPQNPKMCDPILVTLLKMRPHYSQSSCENATPSSGTSPLASYKDVPIPRSTPRAKCLSLSSAFSSAWDLSAQCLRRRGLTKVNTLKVQFWNYSKQQNKIQTFGPSDDLWQSPPMPHNTPPPTPASPASSWRVLHSPQVSLTILAFLSFRPVCRSWFSLP